jgi:large subunit ribosomal protein L11
MAKKVKTIIKLQVPAGKATPAPPIGPSLAQHRINISEFCQKFKDKTSDQKGWLIPVEIKVYEDGSYDFKLKQPPTSELIKKTIGLEKGSKEPNRNKAGTISQEQIKEIAQKKIKDLNTNDIKQAMKIVEGTAKSMGLEIKQS